MRHEQTLQQYKRQLSDRRFGIHDLPGLRAEVSSSREFPMAHGRSTNEPGFVQIELWRDAWGGEPAGAQARYSSAGGIQVHSHGIPELPSGTVEGLRKDRPANYGY